MYYTLNEEEFKIYRLCKSEIIKLYNQLLNVYQKGNTAIDKNVEKYGKIIGAEIGKKYKGM